MACKSEVLFCALLARATLRFLWMTSVSGVPTLCPGLALPPGVSSAPRATLTTSPVHFITRSNSPKQKAKTVILSLDSDAAQWVTTLTLKEGLKSWSLLRKREGVSSCSDGSFWKGFLRSPSWFCFGVLMSSLGFISFNTEPNTLLWKRPESSGVTALPTWRPSKGISGDRRAGGGMAGFCEPPTKLSLSLSVEETE